MRIHHFKTIRSLLLFVVFVAFSCKSKTVPISNKGQTNIARKKAKTIKDSPNVLIIYPDQLRRYSAGFWSEPKYNEHVIGKPDPVITPNIDKLAKNGVVFTQAVSNFPLCSPERGMLLSGMYPEQNGIWNNCNINRDESLKSDVLTITDLFYAAGYNTAYFGKCHWLKNDPLFDKEGNYVGTTKSPGGNYLNKYDTYIPPGKDRHSIEYFYESVKDRHFDPLVFSNDPKTIDGKKDGELYRPKVFSPKNEAEKITNYLKNTAKQREDNKPFFIMWSLNPPHNPWNDANTDMEVYRKYYSSEKIPSLDSLVVRKNAKLEVADYARNYFANVTSVDHYIGEVMKALEDIDKLDNTIIIFSSDHGEMLASHGRNGKNIFNTEALAIPFIVHWPKGLEKGKITDILFGGPDVLPTAMGLAGLSSKIPKSVEGIDFSKTLQNKEAKNPEAVLIMLGNSRGIQSKRYTLCLKENKKPWVKKEGSKLSETYLYDNEEDPYQFKKIPLEEKPEVAKKLLKILAKELKRTNDPWYQKRKYNNLINY